MKTQKILLFVLSLFIIWGSVSCQEPEPKPNVEVVPVTYNTIVGNWKLRGVTINSDLLYIYNNPYCVSGNGFTLSYEPGNYSSLCKEFTQISDFKLSGNSNNNGYVDLVFKGVNVSSDFKTITFTGYSITKKYCGSVNSPCPYTREYTESITMTRIE